MTSSRGMYRPIGLLGNEGRELVLLGLTFNRLCKDLPVLPGFQAIEEKSTES